MTDSGLDYIYPDDQAERMRSNLVLDLERVIECQPFTGTIHHWLAPDMAEMAAIAGGVLPFGARDRPFLLL